MSRTTAKLLLVVALGLSGCGKSSSAVPTEAQQTADVLTGDAKGDASTNPQCKKFTVAEIGAYAGTPVNAGENAAMGTGCQWGARNDNGFVMVQVVEAKDHNPTTGAPGYKELPGVGRDGFIVPDKEGGSAAAIAGDKSVNIMITTGATEANVLAFLREAMKRSST